MTNPFLADENDRVLGLTRQAGKELIEKGYIETSLLQEIADVKLDKANVHEMANKSWDICISRGITMPEMQEELKDRK